MASDPPTIHPTRPTERVLWSVKTAIKRTGGEDRARAAVSRLARQTYRWTLSAVPNREELPALLNLRRLTGTAAEVGVAKGDFSEHILTHWRGRRLISVDPWLEMAPEEYIDACNTSQDSMEASYETTRRRLAQFGERSEIWRQLSTEAAERIPPGTLDFVYIDARHTYDGVMEDLDAWFPLVRPGGIIAGHDYNDGHFAEGLHGVRSAVDQFFGARKIGVRHTHTDVPSISWLVQAPS